MEDLTRLKLALLSQVNKDTWSESGTSGFLEAFGFGSGDWKQFNNNRTSFFQKLHLDIDYFKSINVRSETLDDKAYHVIEKCIETVAGERTGLQYVTYMDDTKNAAIRFFWITSHSRGDDVIKVTDSWLENATAKGYVQNQPVAPGKLFPKPSWWELFTPYPSIDRRGPLVYLDRKGHERDTIRAGITTPETGQPIIVPPFEPEPKFDRLFIRQTWGQTTYPLVLVNDAEEGKETYKTGRIYTAIRVNDGNFVQIRDKVDGVVVGVTCDYRGHSHFHFRGCGRDPKDNTVFECRADMNGAAFPVEVTVRYLEATPVCSHNCGNDEVAVTLARNRDYPELYVNAGPGRMSGNPDGDNSCTWSADRLENTSKSSH
jgi:hypothetical protein